MKLFSLYRSYWWRSWAITWNCTLLGQKPFSRWFKIVQNTFLIDACLLACFKIFSISASIFGMCNVHLDANDWGWNKKKLKQANAYSLKTLQMAWLGDQVTIWGEDAHHRLGLWALHQHHRHPQPTPWWHRCPDWPCPGNCIFCVEDYKRKHIQQCYLLCLQLPTHTHTHKKERKKSTSATDRNAF